MKDHALVGMITVVWKRRPSPIVVDVGLVRRLRDDILPVVVAPRSGST